MEQERRKTQCVAPSAETSFSPRGESKTVPYTDWIANMARSKRHEKINNLMHFFSVTNLAHAYTELDGSKAVGSDGITKEMYGENLMANLESLHARMKKLAYRPADARVVLIPKADGHLRPIAISNFEDKLVQKIASDILTSIDDASFHRFSFGFRPERSCHGAISYLYNHIRRNQSPWMVDVDLKSFFDSVNHKKLIEILSYRISDKTFLRYMVRLLRSGILVEGASEGQDQGTPQGSIVSPILANIFLHHVLDEWFVKTIKPQMKSEMVRYADDFVVAMKTEEEAREFMEQLKMRLAEYGLSINENKTRIVCIDQNNPKERSTFDFLGFTFYWGKWIGGTTLKVRTSRKTLVKKVQDFEEWIKANRSRYSIESLWEKISQKLQGHYQYFGVSWNRWKLLHFYHKVIWKLFHWINKRSQKVSYTWEGFKMRLKRVPLPLPMETNQLIQLTNPRCYYA